MCHTPYHLLFNHLSVRTKVVERSGQKVVGLADPITLIGNNLAGTVYIVVIAVDLDQASIGLDTIDIVIKLAVLADDAVLLPGLISED